MQAKPLLRFLRVASWFFGVGAALFVAAVVIASAGPNTWFLSLILAAGGALVWAQFAYAVLVLFVEVAEAPQRRAAD